MRKSHSVFPWGLSLLVCFTFVDFLTAQVVDVNEHVRQIEKLQSSNKTSDIETIARLIGRVKMVSPEMMSNESLMSTFIAPEAVSTKYANLGCDLVSAIRNESSTTYLTFYKLKDGLGNVLVQLIKAMAFTYSKGWNFLGVIGHLQVLFGNHEDDVVNFYFGNHTPLITSPALFPQHVKVVTLGNKIRLQATILEKAPTTDNVVYRLDTNRFELEHYISKLHGMDNHDLIKNITNEYFSPSFLSHLRNNAACGIRRALSSVKRDIIDNQPPSAIKVVVHVRTGDVLHNDKFAYKRIPLTYYPYIFKVIRSLCPLCKLFAFASVQYPGQLEYLKAFQNSMHEIGVTVYVDSMYGSTATDEALNTIAHFSTADVFVAAKSEFSLVAAYLNPNCVVYTNYAANFPLNDWIILPHVHVSQMKLDSAVATVIEIIERNLLTCLARKVPHKKPSR